MTGLIGWLVAKQKGEEEELNMILGVDWIIGMALLFIVSILFISVEPANSNQLNISDEQAPLLLKNALHLTADPQQSNFQCYKPYSIFGEQLSHISEEDASQLDRMFTTNTADNSLRHVDSIDSNRTTPSFYTQQQEEFFSQEDNNISSMTIIPTVPANALALLPLPTPTDPLVAFFHWMRSSSGQGQEEQEDICPNYYYNSNNRNNQQNKINNWKLDTLSFTLFLLGVSYALLNTFLFIYIYSILQISIYIIACLIMIHISAEMIVSFTIEKV